MTLIVRETHHNPYITYRETEKFVEFRKMEISHPKIFNFPISRLKLAKSVPGDSPLFADFKDTNLSIY
jgi:hypothetical protein